MGIFVYRSRSQKSDNFPLVDIAKGVAPPLGLDSSKLSKGASDYDPSKVTPTVYFSTEKREKILGIKEVRSKEETTKDVLASFKDQGWVA